MKKCVCVLTLIVLICMELCSCGAKSGEAGPAPTPPESGGASPTTAPFAEGADAAPSYKAEPTQSVAEAMEQTAMPGPLPSPSSTVIAPEPEFYVRLGDYAQENELGWANTVTVESISEDHSSLTLSASWTRYTGFDHVTANLNGNKATFDTGVQLAEIEFEKDALQLTFLTEPEEGQYGFDVGTSRFRYFTQEDWDRLTIECDTDYILSNDESLGWIHENVTYVGEDELLQGSVYPPSYLRFFPDGTLTYWCTVPGAESDTIYRHQTTYQIALRRLFIGDVEYEMWLDSGALPILHLTAVDSDALGLQGTYMLGDDRGIYPQLQQG